jgi:hypothetical protein
MIGEGEQLSSCWWNMFDSIGEFGVCNRVNRAVFNFSARRIFAEVVVANPIL